MAISKKATFLDWRALARVSLGRQSLSVGGEENARKLRARVRYKSTQRQQWLDARSPVEHTKVVERNNFDSIQSLVKVITVDNSCSTLNRIVHLWILVSSILGRLGDVNRLASSPLLEVGHQKV